MEYLLIGAVVIVGGILCIRWLIMENERQDNEQDEAHLDTVSGDFDRRIRGYTRQLAQRRNKGARASIYSDRARDYRQRGECDMALADLNQAIRLNPNLAYLYHERAYTYFLRGLLDTSDWAKYDASVHHDITSIIDFERRGGTWSEAANSDFDRAIADYDQGIRLKGPYFESRGNAYVAKGDFDRGIADYNEAIRLSLQDTNDRSDQIGKAKIYGERAMAYYQKGEFDRAIFDYSEAIRRIPDEKVMWMHHGRGRAYSAKGDTDRAIADFDEAVKIGGMAPLIDRGLLHQQRGDVAPARADFEAALKLQPGNEKAKACLARLGKANG